MFRRLRLVFATEASVAVDMLFQLLLSMVAGWIMDRKGQIKIVCGRREMQSVLLARWVDKRREVQQSQLFGKETGNSKSQVRSAARISLNDWQTQGTSRA